ncbi:MAG: UDP-N-acetylmuramoyl-tripeptide--D-alanyl-D-alanine ligase [Hyphomonadaceae bacterium]|nr:UDP-N-acetylmuramoyl-tripeptide--D-alanyl-D-alanine ligase [Hyphomonadaceae bacterium]
MNEALWLAEDAAAATGGHLIGADSWIASGVSIDTRSLERGDLFVALKDVRDGHTFIADAFARGAAAALVSDAEAARPHGPALVVRDVLDALRALGIAARDRSKAVRIAVTGSVGKTSTKEAIAAALRAGAPTHASVKSYNNHWGVPLTLARLPISAQYAVLECGMNHRGEIRPLADMVAPDIAVVTWIAPAHIENLGSLEAIAEEKGDLYTGLGPAGAALVPNEAPCAHVLLAAAENNAGSVIRFGREAGCEARLLRFDMHDDGATAEADILGRQIRYRIGAPGAHWALNSVAALAAADLAGADVFAAAHALAQFGAIAGRGAARVVASPGGAFTLIDDSYNANPASMAAAFETLGARTLAAGGRRIAALGDMLELGADELRYHADLATPLARARIDLVFCAGPRMRALYDALPDAMRGAHAETAAALAPIVAAAVRADDAVLVKGSNSSRMALVVDALAQLES